VLCSSFEHLHLTRSVMTWIRWGGK